MNNQKRKRESKNGVRKRPAVGSERHDSKLAISKSEHNKQKTSFNQIKISNSKGKKRPTFRVARHDSKAFNNLPNHERKDKKIERTNNLHDRFLELGDPSFEKMMDSEYNGFKCDKESTLTKIFGYNLHEEVEKAFCCMHKNNLFRTDVTQPFGLESKCAKTFVTRCLLGKAGTTYKYLGLRMFSHPWDKGLEKCSNEISSALTKVKELNLMLSRRAKFHINEKIEIDGGNQNSTKGGCDFTVALINRMDPLEIRPDLKLEPMFKNDFCSVSWHADSCLEHYSTIAVYHQTDAEKDEPPDWRIALRVEVDAEGPRGGKKKQPSNAQSPQNFPPIAVALPNKSAYYLLGDFNHHHQHAVLAGNSTRYSSTHRVGKSEGHTFSYIQSRCDAVIKHGAHKRTIKQWRAEQALLSEIEFEWLRQWFIQGKAHAESHGWWSEPIQSLIKCWCTLEERTSANITLLWNAALSKKSVSKNENGAARTREDIKTKKRLQKSAAVLETLGESAYQVIATALEERSLQRKGWAIRERDQVFKHLPSDMRPLKIPLFTASAPSCLPADCIELAGHIRACADCFSGRTQIMPQAYQGSDAPICGNLNKNSISENAEEFQYDWKSLNWVGLEVQSPWVSLLLSGKKKIETRTYPLPTSLLNRKIFLIESMKNSKLDNIVQSNSSEVKIAGTVTFDGCYLYKSKKQFETDVTSHCVDRNSNFSWEAIMEKQKGTKSDVVIYGWNVAAVESHEMPIPVPELSRVYRSLFKLKKNDSFR